jgi:hypothetical protein
MKQVPHVPYSPPSDFFLFGCVKGKLMGYRAETTSELFVCIRVILAEIPRETLDAVFSNGWSDCKTACRQMVSMSDELKERNILKLILIVRFACATLDVGHPIFAKKILRFESDRSAKISKIVANSPAARLQWKTPQPGQ